MPMQLCEHCGQPLSPPIRRLTLDQVRDLSALYEQGVILGYSYTTGGDRIVGEVRYLDRIERFDALWER